MVCCVVEYATLLTVNSVVMGCPWCVVETVGEGTSLTSTLSRWGGGCRGMCWLLVG